MKTPRFLASYNTLSVVALIGAVAAFAAFTPTSPRPLPHAPERPAPSDRGSPPWALALPDGAQEDTAPAEAAETRITGKVLEQIDVAKYSYLRLGAPARPDTWAAVPFTESLRDQTVSVVNAEQMTNFSSTSLKRTFDVIYFGVLDDPAAAAEPPLAGSAGQLPEAEPHAPQMAPHPGAGNDADAIPVRKCAKAPGPLGRTVAELNGVDASASGGSARVRGTVVKATNGVMGRTFLHVRDATGAAPLSHDLTVTTTEDLVVGVQVLLEGTVKVDEDFGSGYRYHVLLADAHRVSE